MINTAYKHTGLSETYLVDLIFSPISLGRSHVFKGEMHTILNRCSKVHSLLLHPFLGEAVPIGIAHDYNIRK